MASTELSRKCDQAFLKLPKEVKAWLNEKKEIEFEKRETSLF